jgi:hypothetical protein
LLEWVERKGVVLERQVVSSGLENALNGLRKAGMVKMGDDPHVKDAMGYPARSVFPVEPK